jgi:hypothetical protein
MKQSLDWDAQVLPALLLSWTLRLCPLATFLRQRPLASSSALPYPLGSPLPLEMSDSCPPAQPATNAHLVLPTQQTLFHIFGQFSNMSYSTL